MSDKSSSGEENSSADDEEFQESELKKKVQELDTENKNLKKRLDRTIELFDNSKNELGKMNKKIGTLKAKQKKIQKRSEVLDKETGSLKKQIDDEHKAKERLKRELHESEEKLSALRSQRREGVDPGAVSVSPIQDEMDDDFEKPKAEKKILTKTVSKIHSPLHGLFLIIGMVVEACFWCLCTFFYVNYFVQIRSIFTEFNVLTGFGAFVIIFYIIILIVGFLNTLGGISIAILIFIGWSWCSVRLIVANLFFSIIALLALWVCFGLSGLVSLIGIAIDQDREVQIIFLICHLVLYLVSLLSIIWTVALIYAFVRENDECTKKMCVMCFKALPIDHDRVPLIGGFIGKNDTSSSSEKVKKGKKQKKKKRRKSSKASDSDEPLEFESGSDGGGDFEFERADDDDGELIFE